MDIQKEIAELLELIKQKRKEKGISQQEIADYLGISQNAYKNIEIGRTSLKLETLYQIASYLGIDIFQEKQNKSSQALVALDPNDLTNNITNIRNDLRRVEDKLNQKQDDMNQKLDEILDLFGKKKKK